MRNLRDRRHARGAHAKRFARRLLGMVGVTAIATRHMHSWLTLPLSTRTWLDQ